MLPLGQSDRTRDARSAAPVRNLGKRLAPMWIVGIEPHEPGLKEAHLGVRTPEPGDE